MSPPPPPVPTQMSSLSVIFSPFSEIVSDPFYLACRRTPATESSTGEEGTDGLSQVRSGVYLCESSLPDMSHMYLVQS